MLDLSKGSTKTLEVVVASQLFVSTLNALVIVLSYLVDLQIMYFPAVWLITLSYPSSGNVKYPVFDFVYLIKSPKLFLLVSYVIQ